MARNARMGARREVAAALAAVALAWAPRASAQDTTPPLAPPADTADSLPPPPETSPWAVAVPEPPPSDVLAPEPLPPPPPPGVTTQAASSAPPSPPGPAWPSASTSTSAASTSDDRLALQEGRGRMPGALGLEILGGVLGYAIGLAPLYAALSGDDGGSLPALVVTVPFGIALGIWLPGMLSGGNGGFGWTFLGQALGGIASVPIVFSTLFDTDETGAWVALAAVLTFPIIGGVLGYELSNDVSTRGSVPAPRRSPYAMRVGAAPLPHGGGSLALRGTF